MSAYIMHPGYLYI